MVKTHSVTLFIGDLAVFVGSLFLALFVRYLEVPSEAILYEHLRAFIGIFVVWVGVFFIMGLYDPHIGLSRKKIPDIVVRSQLANAGIAVLIFFLFPVGVTPKITLAIYLLISTVLVIVWRLFLFPLIAGRSSVRTLIVGSSTEAMDLVRVLSGGKYFQFVEAHVFDPSHYPMSESLQDAFRSEIALKKFDLVVGETHGPYADLLTPLYLQGVFIDRHISFASLSELHEEVFNKIPPGLVKEEWILENISQKKHQLYTTVKRIFDVVTASVLGILSLCLYPFIALAIKLEDGGSIFIVQERIGQYGKPIRIIKFRSMTGVDRGSDALQTKHQVTKVGKIIRKFRLDELPQLLNVFRGDLSFIGPRPEIPALAEQYEKEIPYYAMRNLVKPGLSGWAQIYHEAHPHHGIDVLETTTKLSYDLYYLKHRSFMLDMEIVLKTVRILLGRHGM